MASKSLFDHIKAITNEQDPKYWDKLEERKYLKKIKLIDTRKIKRYLR